MGGIRECPLRALLAESWTLRALNLVIGFSCCLPLIEKLPLLGVFERRV